MSNSLDLSPCNQEPIRHLGLVQNHGVLVALTPDLRVSHVSENAADLLRRSAVDLLGRPAKEIWINQDLDWLAHAPAALRERGPAYRIWDLGHFRTAAWVHRHDDRIILELEPGAAEEAVNERIGESIAAIAACGNMLGLVQQAAEAVASNTGYSRVMCYRFLDDFSGEVIAEARKSHLEPFLGLRYPASDIPQQARQLYSEDLVRALVDVNGLPVPVLALPHDTRPLDLSHAVLRSVSPYHVQYLKNMGVAATATVSIVSEGRLWGLITCHHAGRRPLPPPLRMALHRIAIAVGAKVDLLMSAARKRTIARIDGHVSRLRPESGRGSLIRQLFIGPPHIKTLFGACGIALSGPYQLRTRRTPGESWIERFASWALSQPETIRSAECLAAHPVGAPEPDRWSGGKITGALSVVLSRDPATVLIFFREELIQQVRWGGDINKPALRDEVTHRISPRRSFAEFKQTIQDKSAPWTADDLEAAGQLWAALHRLLPDDGSIAEAIQEGTAELRNLISQNSPLTDVVLESVADGVALIAISGGSSPCLRYANRGYSGLLERELGPEGGVADLASTLRAAGLDANLFEKARAAPCLVEVGSSVFGRRDLMVRVDRILEVQEGPEKHTLSAMTLTDVTETLRAHDTLAAAKTRAEQASLAKSAFLANMSHEIRTPLNGILGTTQLLASNSLTAEQQDCVDLIQRSGESLLTLLNDVLDFSKIEAGRLELDSVSFDLFEVVEDVAKLMQASVSKKNIGLEVNGDSHAMHKHVVGDPARLRQVLLNLLGNAIKFTDEGHVGIRVTAEPQDSRTWMFRFTVSDTGIGIAAPDLAKLFQQFNQVDGSNSRKYGGTGLGLAISKQLIELMGGQVQVTSIPGAGSEFRFELALPLDSTLGQDQPAVFLPPVKASSKGSRILLAEDNQINQIVARKLISRLGYSVDLAVNGREAVEMWRGGGYDLILMDCQMPEMDGYEAVEQIRRLEGSGHHTTIIALTANALAGDRQRCLAAGMDEYLSKPIQLRELSETLSRWIDTPALEEQARV